MSRDCEPTFEGRVPRLADRASVARAGTSASHERAADLRSEGREILPLSGVPPWGPPSHALEAVAATARSGAPQRSSAAGSVDLRESIAEKVWIENSIPSGPERVLVTNGAKEGIHLALSCTVAPGDEVIVPTP